MKLRFIIPLVLFAVLVGFLAVGLTRDPREVPSPLVGKPAPAFRIPQLSSEELAFTPADMKGQVWVLNVWASWCVACRVEHPLLMELAKAKVVPVIGLNYKDQREDGLKFLSANGDPYTLSAMDKDGRVGIDYGVYGVPETFVIDKQGVIRMKHIGPIMPDDLQQKILPMLAKLKKT